MMGYIHPDVANSHYGYHQRSPGYNRHLRFSHYMAPDRILDVWQQNVEEEFEKISKLIEQYPYVAMDTEFPGWVIRFDKGASTFTPAGSFKNMRFNVNALKVIQIGISLFDEYGQQPHGISTWQFNFKYNYLEELHNTDSIDLLMKSGLQFHRLIDEGISHQQFSVLLTTSGLIANPSINWITFHSSQDFGYLLRLLTNSDIPDTVQDFYKILFDFFPVFYDIRVLVKDVRNLRGGLQEMSETLLLQRHGTQHQAGSDALLTGQLFFRLRENNNLPIHKRLLDGSVEEDLWRCHLYMFEPPNSTPSSLT